MLTSQPSPSNSFSFRSAFHKREYTVQAQPPSLTSFTVKTYLEKQNKFLVKSLSAKRKDLAVVLAERINVSTEVIDVMDREVPAEFLDSKFVMMLITYLGDAKKSKTVYQLYRWWQRSSKFEMNLQMITKVLSIISRAKMMKEAELLFDETISTGLEVDAPFYNALLLGYCRTKKFGQALKLLETMKSREAYCHPTLHTYGILIMGFGKGKKYNQAKKLFEEVRERNLKPNLALYNTMLNICKENRDSEALEKLLEEMEAQEIVPDSITYTGLLKFFQEERLFDRILQLGEFLLNRPGNGLMDEKLYSAIISTAGEMGRFDLVEMSFKQMIETGFKVDEICLYSLLNSMLKCGKEALFDEFWEEMKKKSGETGLRLYHINEEVNDSSLVASFRNLRQKIPPISTQILNLVLERHSFEGKVREMEETLEFMEEQSLSWNKQTYEALLWGYAKAGNVRKVEDLVGNLRKASYGLSRRAFNALIEVYGSTGQLEKMEMSFKQMKKGWIEPDEETWISLQKSYEILGVREMADFSFQQLTILRRK